MLGVWVATPRTAVVIVEVLPPLAALDVAEEAAELDEWLLLLDELEVVHVVSSSLTAASSEV